MVMKKNAKKDKIDLEAKITPKIKGLKISNKPKAKKGDKTFCSWINELAQKLRSKTESEQEKLLKELFPRTIDSVIPIAGKKKKDTGEMKLTYCFDSQEELPPKQIFRTDIPRGILAMFSQSFIGWQACAYLYQSHWAISRACNAPAEDAMAPGYHLTYSHTDDKPGDPKKLVEIVEKSKNIFKIPEICVRAESKTREFGGIVVVPDIDGVDFEKPFNIDAVKKGAYRGLQVVEPYWIQPELDSNAVLTPESIGFYEPTFYKISGKKIRRYHRSWVIPTVHIEVADYLKPMYYWFGPSVPQLIYEAVAQAQRVATEAPLLAQTKRLVVVDADLMNYSANQKEADMALQNLTYLRDNFGVYVKNPGDDLIQLDTTLSDFPDLIMVKWQEVSAAAEMPAVKLLKTQPKGFNSTGEYEENDYKQALKRIQENKYKKIINFHNMLFTKSEYGQVLNLVTQFYPIDTPSEAEQSEIAEKLSLELIHYVSGGIISHQEARDVLRNDPRGIYTFLKKEIPENLEELNSYFPFTEKDNKGRPQRKSESPV